MTIVKPSVASRSATAAPMPRDAPVTIATLLVLSVILQSPVVISGNAFRGEKDSHFWRALTALRSSRGVGLERDDFSSNRHPALSFCLSMISAQTLRVCREGKPVPTHRVVARGHAFPDHALARARDNVHACAVSYHSTQLLHRRRKLASGSLMKKTISIRYKERDQFLQGRAAFGEDVWRQFHHENRPAVPQQRGGTAEHFRFKPINIDLYELYGRPAEFGQNAVNGAGTRRVRRHRLAEMLGVQVLAFDQGPAGIDRSGHIRPVIRRKEKVKRRHPFGEIAVEIQVAAEFLNCELGWLERKNPAGRPDEASEKQGMNANIGADIEHDRRRLDQLFERVPCARLKDAEINRKIDALREI